MFKPKCKYIDLPIFGIATYGSRIFFSGGGGHGIPNQILIYEEKGMQQLKKIQTNQDIIQNLVTNSHHHLLGGSANQDIVIYEIIDNGKDLKFLFRFHCDNSLKEPTLNSLYWKQKSLILATGGDDCIARVFDIHIKQSKATKLFQTFEHTLCLKHVFLKHSDPILISNDIYTMVISNYKKGQTIKRITTSILNPINSQFQSGYFYKNQLIIISYMFQGYTYLTRYDQTYDQYSTTLAMRDQSCLTAIKKNKIAIAAGNGVVQIIDTKTGEPQGKSHNHDMVIKGLDFIGTNKVVSGSPQCSYHIQITQNQWGQHVFYLFLLILLLWLSPKGEL